MNRRENWCTLPSDQKNILLLAGDGDIAVLLPEVRLNFPTNILSFRIISSPSWPAVIIDVKQHC